MSAHTPGPWSLFIESEVVRPGIEAKGVPFTVVVWGADDDREGVHGRTSDEAMANARLIAAAPELLGELRKVADYLDATATCNSDKAIAASARAAIAKAEGRA